MDRSSRAEVRNPLLALPGAVAIMALPIETRQVLRDLLLDLRRDAQARAAESWKRHKAPVACYWKCVATYCGHIARLLR